jgi:very-short-patch-repair endonuclease
LHDRGVPPPELQVWIQDGYGARIGRVDFFWPEYRTIAEADGAIKYKDSAAARKQLERHKKLRRAGYELVHFGWQGIIYDTDLVIGELQEAFARGEE